MSMLPASWVNCTIGAIADSMKNGIYKPSSAYADDGVACLRMYNVENGRIVWRDIKRMILSAEDLEQYLLRAGDLLVNRVNSRELVGKTAVIPANLEPCVFESKNIRLRLNTDLAEPNFVSFKLLLDGSRYFTSNAQQVVGMASISQPQLAGFSIPLPPLAEQKRIVAKIEELFSELDAGEESLRQARQQLGVYRQSLLKQAFEGRLTEKWRAENTEINRAPTVPPMTERQEFENLPSLPSSWVWTKLSAVGDLGRGKSKHRPRNDPTLFGGPYPFIQTGEVKAATKIITAFSETYSAFGLAQSKLWPKGTLCITIAANIAETAFLGFDACFPDSVVGFVPRTQFVRADFIELFIRGARSRIEKYAPATAQKNINLTTLENLAVPLCSLPEQQEIVRILDAQFEAIEQNEREIDQALRKSEALRQSILKKAFSGQLVPQDPADEPATTLLARLSVERDAKTEENTFRARRASAVL